MGKIRRDGKRGSDFPDRDGFTVIAYGKNHAEIILPEDPTVIEIFAKEELVHYLNLMTSGAPAQDDVPAEPLARIRFVRRETGKPLWYPDTDRFEIEVDKSDIRLIGTSRSLLYAVYSLLEFLGARFYFPGQDDAIFPVKELLTIPSSFTVSRESQFPYRAINLESILRRDKMLLFDHIDWMAKNRFNILCTHPKSYGIDLFSTDLIRFEDIEGLLVPEIEKRGIALNMNVHTTFFFLPPEKYAVDHPDWYSIKIRSVDNPPRSKAERSWCAGPMRKYKDEKRARIDFYLTNLLMYFQQPIDILPLMPDNNISPQQRLWGLSVEQGIAIPAQICYSNRDAIQTYCNNIKDYLRNHPHVRIVGLWPTDIGSYDYCNCEKSVSDPQAMLKAIIWIAQQLGSEFPDLIVEHIIYMGPSRTMPSDDLVIPKNMVILQATGDQELIDVWLDKCKKDKSLGMYKVNYTLADNFYACGHVCIDPKKTIDDFQYMQKCSFIGYDIMYIDMYSYWRSCQNLALLAKLSWEPDFSYGRYLKDFCSNYFGIAGEQMELLYRKMFELDQKALFSEASEEAYERNSAIINECRHLLVEAKNIAAGSGQELLLSRLDKVRVYIDHLALYGEASLYRTRAKLLMGQKNVKAAAMAMRQVALKEEEIKTMCLNSYFRGDGVLDLRLTLARRKFGRFLEDRKMIKEILNGLETLGTTSL